MKSKKEIMALWDLQLVRFATEVLGGNQVGPTKDAKTFFGSFLDFSPAVLSSGSFLNSLYFFSFEIICLSFHQ